MKKKKKCNLGLKFGKYTKQTLGLESNVLEKNR